MASQRMSSRLLCVASACLLWHAGAALAAGAVYKCHEGGRVIYADRPCAGIGAELPVRAAPAPDPATEKRLRRAHALARELDAKRAERAEHDRREARDDERARRAVLAQRQRCARLRLELKWREEDLAHARGAAQGAARTRLRRQAEAVAMQCPA